ncbi:SMI1/KNR4 family protein [Virgibacillus dakarensis]|uniref:SMI1/KNR4 family protein n=1 Tax=Lentibacillus populi TaxID=1827502 RepID=A0A9W5X6X9_9BACI|nr:MULTISPECIES: SMI1/KNR4 family protein [Bacillaceae]MBT2215557.1 SMI1/KNR4 family protein [Virgibacillus dakarensis]MTW86008.1 SMI1/KNR4 family protein [Virgibacillus dakarensis]GGB56536.1 SMI1/KNR4 family protein [Lentibacillus populi]
MELKELSIITPLPDDELLLERERKCEISLPESYKKFIKEYSGAIPRTSSFPSNGHSYAIDRFLCILEETENHDLGVYDIDVTLTRIEERLTDNEDLTGVELLPIAIFFQVIICGWISKNTNTYASVCIWSHEESGELDPVTYFVCKNFDEFLEM